MSKEKTKIGKRQVAFKFKEAFHDLPITVPCGKCVGCLMERARQWSVRVVHEAKFHDKKSFITLTYNEENLPRTSSGLATLSMEDWQRFMKRLRRRRSERIRFLSCGEYGALGRPHYHALLFGCDFPDRKVAAVNNQGDPVYSSEELSEIWSKGFVTIGEVTKESAAYVARYTTKKIVEVDTEVSEEASGGDRRGFDREGRRKEFIVMSRRPGIGRQWIEKYYKDVYPGDKVVLDGGVVGRPPRYYDEVMKERDPKLFRRLKRRRIDKVDRSEQRVMRLHAKKVNMERRLKDHMKRGIQ